ncbi:hypothetical protein BTO30_14770 [Domibacillus antri]|uniref:Methyl-accepting transducer domain-containing protein n=1 Tax=Domibacillus antri TaxID=1714264 RepID=A0A1Q8Q285_9BACI|nr:methyl-accepting chemotaxis protein [Domibacillus antri]OLN21463.1 hypothetical protein BTO30_14770 [Domibacillus antri]
MSLLDHFVTIGPYFHQLVLDDCHYTVTDTKKFIVSVPSKTLKMAINVGYPVKEGSISGLAIQQRKQITRQGNKELYGIAHIAVCTPIFEKGAVIGCISIGYSQEKNDEIFLLSENIAAMVQELSASAQSFSASSQELAVLNQGMFECSDVMKEEMGSIAAITDFASKIAKETNMIGLNASIQSAHAGEYGKGFSVVAKEIRRMAEKSSESSKTIKQQILNVQSTVNAILESIQQSSSFSMEQAAASQQLSASIEELNNIAQKLKDLAKLH